MSIRAVPSPGSQEIRASKQGLWKIKTMEISITMFTTINCNLSLETNHFLQTWREIFVGKKHKLVNLFTFSVVKNKILFKTKAVTWNISEYRVCGHLRSLSNPRAMEHLIYVLLKKRAFEKYIFRLFEC